MSSFYNWRFLKYIITDHFSLHHISFAGWNELKQLLCPNSFIMCKEFLWLSKIKPIASHQAESIHVYIWPTLFGRTIINLWNYNLKHNEGKLLRKIPLLMNEVRHQVHCSALHHRLQCLDWKSLSVAAATVPCRDRALYFHTGRWISRRWTKPGTLPRISGSQQAIWSPS